MYISLPSFLVRKHVLMVLLLSRQLNISRHCVQNAVKKYKTHQYNDFPRTARPEKIPNRGVPHLRRLVKDNGRLSAAKITSDLNASLPKPVSTRTVRRYLRDLGYEYVVKIKNNGSVTSIDNNVLTGVHSICIGHRTIGER